MKTQFLNRFAFVRRAIAAGFAMTALAAGLGSCDQNFTAPDPNSPSPETAGLQSLVTGTIANFRYTEINEFIGIAGREMYTSAADDPRILQQPIGQNQLDNTAFVVNVPWNQMYYTIANCRNLVDFGPKLPNAQQRAGLEGFAKTIQAHELMRLSGIWYDEGIKIEYRLDRKAPFVTHQQSLTEVARILDEANTALAQAGNTFAFRLGAGFAGYDTPAQFARVNRALRARCAAYQGDYAACLTALGASFLREGNTAADMALGINHVYSTQPGDVPPRGRGGIGGNPFFQNLAAPSLRWWVQRNFLSDNPDSLVDLRILNKCAIPSVVRVPASIGSGAGLSSPRAINLYPTQNSPTSIIRNEELLLLRAEARMLGATPDLAGALADINRVRTASNAPALTTVGADRNAQISRLLYERRYSLFFEGFRWVDHKRFNRLAELPVERPIDRLYTAGWPKPVNEIDQ
ncbi:MAG: RagB/SusD family nutrient uptake outer membrane protein [Candidatus Kapaibacterium sp.]|nr:MAG: RagB/SusD family nutrient uptake outer membrane protein [Candidatus Kapabacteria bacterium]